MSFMEGSAGMTIALIIMSNLQNKKLSLPITCENPVLITDACLKNKTLHYG